MQHLRDSIEHQIEDIMIANPNCNREASLQVDRLLICMESMLDHGN